ncbi:hypothetical protein T265_08675 [Opisthorchis viverrini]|uniref:Uncharacterized protein n=1 Tax=Opisthorchis viverrini TaxID=6198 RepID=A0A074Z8C0_OPIVI|nr:hypothetical protein T265_08675 [Opisthorchis viverrini]KER23456.1 hypothetical protein T265_08675 [Opisthorchis viverrini]
MQKGLSRLSLFVPYYYYGILIIPDGESIHAAIGSYHIKLSHPHILNTPGKGSDVHKGSKLLVQTAVDAQRTRCQQLTSAVSQKLQ